MAKQSETWMCDICREVETADHFPKEWFRVEITSGYGFYGIGDNRNVHRDCCSKACVKKAVEPLVE